MKTSVFIGRFAPFHNGHKSVVDAALKVSDQVIIVVGSSFAPRNARNPFTFAERKAMIKSVFPQKEVVVFPVADYQYNDNKWVTAITNTVETAAIGKISLVGYNKDSTSYYLNIFPNWGAYSVPAFTDKKGREVNATDIRKNLFKYNCKGDSLPEPIRDYLDLFIKSAEFTDISKEVHLVEQYKKAWSNTPYPVIFQTVDTVVTQSGCILLVKRKASPGKGLLALPGGFLNYNETLLDGAIRELKEETKLKVPIPVLKGSIKAEKVFDDPNRSTRGRTITTAFHIDLGFTSSLSKVIGSDDAEKALWVPFNQIDRSKIFEDHYAIIDYFLGISSLNY